MLLTTSADDDDRPGGSSAIIKSTGRCVSSLTRTIATALGPCAPDHCPMTCPPGPTDYRRPNLACRPGLAGVALTTTLPSIALAGPLWPSLPLSLAENPRRYLSPQHRNHCQLPSHIAVAKTLP